MKTKKKLSDLKKQYRELTKDSGVIVYTSRSGEHRCVYFNDKMQEGRHYCDDPETITLTPAHPTIEEALKIMCKILATYGLDLDTENEKYENKYVLFDEMLEYIRNRDVGSLCIVENNK